MMNYSDTLKSVDLVLATGEVPLIVGETGIGKTALAKELAEVNDWSLIVIDGNLLKEGEIGGLPTIEPYTRLNRKGEKVEKKSSPSHTAPGHQGPIFLHCSLLRVLCALGGEIRPAGFIGEGGPALIFPSPD